MVPIVKSPDPVIVSGVRLDIVDSDWPPRPLHWPEQTLTDGTVVLDRMTSADVADVVAAIDADIHRWLPLPQPYSDEDAVAFLGWQARAAERGEALNFALRDAPAGRLSGSIGLHFRAGPGVSEIGYWIAPWARGRRFAAAGTRVLARHAFATYPVRRVEVLVDPANIASRRAAERAGALAEGLRRAALEVAGEPRPAMVYALVRDDEVLR